MMNTKSRKIIIFSALFLGVLGFTASAEAADISDAQTGNWSDTATWTGGVVPVAGDNVTIDSGTVTLTADAACTNITIASGGTLSAGTYTITVSGSWDSSATGATFTRGTSHVNLTGTGTLKSKTANSFYQLTMAAAGQTTTLTSNIIVMDDCTLGTGTLAQSGTRTLTIRKSGTGLINNGATVNIGTLTYTWTNPGNIAAGTYTLSNGLYLGGGAGNYTFQLAGDIQINTGSFYINLYNWSPYSTTFNTQNYNLTAGGLIIGPCCGEPNGAVTLNLGSSTLDIGSSGLGLNPGATTTAAYTLNLGSSTFYNAGKWEAAAGTYSITVNPGTSTVTFDGTSDQTITTNSQAFNDLTLNNTGASGSDDIIISGALDVNGTLTITDGDLDISTNNPAVTTAGNVSIGASGSVTKGTGTWTFDGTTSATLTDSDSTASTQNLGNVQIGDGTNAKTVNLGSAVKTDNLTISANGTLDASSSNYGLTCAGNWSNSGTFNEQQGTVTFTGTSKTIPAETFYGLTNSGTVSTTGNVTATNFSNSGTFTVSTGNTLTPSSSGTYTNTGTVTESGTGKVILPAVSCTITDVNGTENNSVTTDSDIYVTLTDYDENKDGTTADLNISGVTVSTSVDSEALLLDEVGGNATGIFRNGSALPYQEYDGSATANDGILEGSSNATITAVYTDSEDSSDNSASDTATGQSFTASFVVAASTPQVAGSSFTLTITAVTSSGAPSTGYSGTVNLSVTNVSPATGSGTLSDTQLVPADFVLGVATITNQAFSDCGTITITATDTNGITGESGQIVFLPYDFSLTASSVDTAASDSSYGRQTVAKPFTLTITARNASAATCPNYQGTATLSINYTSPSTSQSGSLATTSLTSSYWSSGIATLTTQTYNKWGTITITATDSTSSSNSLTTGTGTSANLIFLPKDFTLSLSSAPKSRTYYYTNENFSATVKTRDYNNSTISNYAGTISFSGSGLNLPPNYTFTSADSGSHTFKGINGTSASTTTLSVKDTTYTSITGASSTITLKAGTIKVISNSGPVGSIAVQVKILDSSGNVLTEDDSTTFTITITEFMEDNNSCTSTATSDAVTVTNGVATIAVKDTEAESVTVTPSSTPTLTAVSGTVRFGTLSGSGVGIQLWREIREPVSYEEE